MPRKGKATNLAEWISSHGVTRIGEAEFGELQTALAPVSAGYLRKLVRATGVELGPLVEGVRISIGEEESVEKLLRSAGEVVAPLS